MPLLSAQSLCFCYGDTPALRDVSFTLAPGEVVALVGPNGSGKSTLIQSLIGGLRAVGAISWNDKPLVQWRRRELAKFVAYLPQSPQHEPGQSVGDVLRLGRSPYLTAFGLESPRDVQTVERIADSLALTSLLRRNMDHLSGGQRQRVFIGRCLVQEPKALLLDEPDTYLDLRHQVELHRILRKLADEQSIGVLVASHDLNLAAGFADRVIVMEAGAVAAAGATRDVLKAELLSRVYGVEVRVIDEPGLPPVITPAI